MHSTLLKTFRRAAGDWRHVTLWLLAGMLVLAWGETPNQSQPSKEYQVKAAFLYNFTQFVEWPAEAFPDAHAPLIIGILGEDPFGTYLDEMVRDEKPNNRPLIVQRYNQVDEIKACHVLFVSQSLNKQMDDIFANLKGRSILTVGDAEGFAKRGGMIRFATEKNKIRLRVNLEAVKPTGLTISSKLLRFAEIVAPGKD